MKLISTISVLVISISSQAQTIDSKNFHSIINGTWTINYVKTDSDKSNGTLKQTPPDTAIIDLQGNVKTISYRYRDVSIEKWESYDNLKKVIYCKPLDNDNKYGELYEKKVISLDKEIIKLEVETVDEGQDGPIYGKMLIILRRVKSNAR